MKRVVVVVGREGRASEGSSSTREGRSVVIGVIARGYLLIELFRG